MSPRPKQNPDDYKIVAVTLAQSADFPDAFWSLQSIADSLEETPHHILWNDAPDETILAQLRTSGREIVEPGENLGVAAGRNELFRSAVDAGAEWIVVLDDDLLVTGDYIDCVRQTIRQLSARDDRLGMFAPAVLSFPALRKVGVLSSEPRQWKRRLKSTSGLSRRLDAAFTESVPRDAVDYMGITDWERHYLSAHGREAEHLREWLGLAVAEADKVNGAVRSRLEARSQIGRGEAIAVDTVPGGVTIISTELIEAIGGLDESMGQFGYEDSEFCIRARESDYSIYVVPDLLVIHDLQGRGKSRELSRVYAGRSRHRAVVMDRYSWRSSGRWLFELFGLGLAEMFGAAGRNEPAGDHDEALRLYIGAMVAFLEQWHSLSVVSEGDTPARRVPTSDGLWSVERVIREQGDVATRAKLVASSESHISESIVELSTSEPTPRSMQVGWHLNLTTYLGSSGSLDVALRRDTDAGEPWLITAMSGSWYISTEDASSWTPGNDSVVDTVLSRQSGARMSFEVAPQTLIPVSEFSVQDLRWSP